MAASAIRILSIFSLVVFITSCDESSSTSNTNLQYDVYGNISGQSGNVTVDLKVNNVLVDTVNLTSSDTSFSFTNATQINDTYQIVVSSAPIGQECAVTDMETGIVGGNVAGVNIYCTAWLYEHNNLRHQLNSGSLPNSPQPSPLEADLIWDTKLAQVAQAYADTCAQPTDGHNNNRLADYQSLGGTLGSVGENMAWGYPSIQGAFSAWSSEESSYVYGAIDGASISNTGHYTQLIWADTTHIGCGVAYGCSGTYSTVYVCNYASAGNYIGQYPYSIP